MADEIAKIETNVITAGFINSKSEGNNNKIEIRAPERTAKFPKKETLKSPKKSGVKKKNYYNTKLTFSKDPRNPNVIAAVALAEAEALATAVNCSDENIQTVGDELDKMDKLNDVVDSDLVDVDPGLTGMEMEIHADEEGVVEAEVEGGEEEEGEEVSGNEMEEVDMIELREREQLVSEEVVVATLPIFVITASDMIKLSAFLTV